MKKQPILYIINNLSVVFCIGFIILISLMLLLLGFEKISGLEIRKPELHENRAYAKLPKFSETTLVELPQNLENYFNDNLPLRNQIIYKYRKIWKNCGPSELILLNGKEGHNFKSVESYKSSIKNISTPILYNLLTYTVGKDYFWKSNNCQYYVFLATDKIMIYPEYLPKWANKSKIKDQNSQIIDFINTNAPNKINLYNLETQIIKHKNQKLLYNKTEDLTHWNGYALEIVYDYFCSILKYNSNFTVIPKESAFSIEIRNTKKGILGVNENIPIMVLNQNGLKKDMEHYKNYPQRVWDGCDIIINDNVDNGTVFLATDSYLKATHQELFNNSNGVIFPLVHNFHKYIHSHYEKNSTKFISNIINKHHPEIALEEFVVRGKPDYANIKIDNREFFIIGELKLDEPKLFVTPDILTSNNINYTNKPIELPKLMPNKDGRVCIMAKIYSSVNAKVILYYKQSKIAGKNYNTIEQDIIKGDNYLYIPVYGEFDKEFKLKLGFSEPSKYTFFQKPTIETICNTKNSTILANTHVENE